MLRNLKSDYARESGVVFASALLVLLVRNISSNIKAILVFSRKPIINVKSVKVSPRCLKTSKLFSFYFYKTDLLRMYVSTALFVDYEKLDKANTLFILWPVLRNRAMFTTKFDFTRTLLLDKIFLFLLDYFNEYFKYFSKIPNKQ